jgi:hypothetical protein
MARRRRTISSNLAASFAATTLLRMTYHEGIKGVYSRMNRNKSLRSVLIVDYENEVWFWRVGGAAVVEWLLINLKCLSVKKYGDDALMITKWICSLPLADANNRVF